MEKEDLLYEDSDFEVYMRGYRQGCKETTEKFVSWYGSEDIGMTPIYARPNAADVWGEPMTQEELDELEPLDDFEQVLYDEGYSDGYHEGQGYGFNDGFHCGYEEAKAYNVILDGEILDKIHDFKEQIMSYRKMPWSENSEHNEMLFEIHKGLMELTECWAMNLIWEYWYRREEELKNE